MGSIGWPARAAAMSLPAGLVLSAVVMDGQERSNKAVMRTEFDAAAQRAKRQLAQRLATYEFCLRGLRGAVLTAGGPGLDRQAFERYAASRDVDREFPGARGIGWIRRVPPADVERYAAGVCADGEPGFAVRQLAQQAGECWVIEHVAPIDRNREAVGLDIASEPRR